MNEPESNRPVGSWFYDELCWQYKGTLPVVVQMEPLEGFKHSPVFAFDSPAEERHRFNDAQPHRKVRRWMILKP